MSIEEKKYLSSLHYVEAYISDFQENLKYIFPYIFLTKRVKMSVYVLI